MTNSFYNDSIDQELSLQELGQANGGIAPLGPLAVIAAVKFGGAAVAAVGVAIAYGVSKLAEGDDNPDAEDSDSEE